MLHQPLLLLPAPLLSAGWAAAGPRAAPWDAPRRRLAPRPAAAPSGSSCGREGGEGRLVGTCGRYMARCLAETASPAPRRPRPHQKKTAPRKLGGVSQPSARPLRCSRSVTSGSIPSSPVAWSMVVTLQRSQGLTLHNERNKEQETRRKSGMTQTPSSAPRTLAHAQKPAAQSNSPRAPRPASAPVELDAAIAVGHRPPDAHTLPLVLSKGTRPADLHRRARPGPATLARGGRDAGCTAAGAGGTALGWPITRFGCVGCPTRAASSRLRSAPLPRAASPQSWA